MSHLSLRQSSGISIDASCDAHQREQRRATARQQQSCMSRLTEVLLGRRSAFITQEMDKRARLFFQCLEQGEQFVDPRIALQKEVIEIDTHGRSTWKQN
ncbi:MAG: hypothetical protein ABL890_00945 [Candidatus Peribacteraceae bacterium]